MSEDVGRGVQVALVVAADQFPILGEGHVTLEDASAHACACFVAFLGVLGNLQRAATAVADGEVGLVEERAVAHCSSLRLSGWGSFVDQVERPRAELDSRTTAVVSVVARGAIGSSAHRDNREEDTNGDDGKGSQTLRHHKLLSVCG